MQKSCGEDSVRTGADRVGGGGIAVVDRKGVVRWYVGSRNYVAYSYILHG